MDRASPIDTDIVPFLASTELFGGIDESVLSKIATDLEWLQIPGGKFLIRQGESADSLYIVINGRLRVTVINKDGSAKVVGEVGRGECVGEMALLTDEPRSANVYALRDTSLLKLGQAGFNHLLEEYPQALGQISRLLVKRLQQSIHSYNFGKTVTTIAVLAVDRNVPATQFTQDLVWALDSTGSTLHLSSDRLASYRNGSQIEFLEDNASNTEFVSWLNEQETKYRFIIYEADRELSAWTKRCIRQADRILIVAQAQSCPLAEQLQDLRLTLNQSDSIAPRELILLHSENSQQVSGTQNWLDLFPFDSHHQIRLNDRKDIQRLVRSLTGKAVGLVLGGGGARGLAHIGVLRAIDEAGISIDSLGGTSMGAIIGALYALGFKYEDIFSKIATAFNSSSGLFDWTLPIVSLTSGGKISAALRDTFGDTQIEDLWLNFFCISSNLTRAKVMVHERGLLWKCLRASCALPGIIPPILYDSDLLLDGGLLNNLPIDVMNSRCKGGAVIAIDVSPKIELETNVQFGDSVSGWNALWQKINPLSKSQNSPHILTLLMQATVLSSRSSRAEMLSQNQSNLYINPPVGEFKIMDFDSIERIVEIGYQSAKEKIEIWQNGDR